jgi:dTDP-4-amino-4,6-dideoxygalactose transaminase
MLEERSEGQEVGMDIQLFVPTFRVEECLQEIRECLEKGWTGLGFKTVAFEEAWKQYTGLPYAHFVNSATAGLHLAVHVLKKRLRWKDGDEIITTPITFVSTNHVILYENLKPVFADVDEYICLDPGDVIKKLSPRTRAIMFVGMGGNTGQYEKIADICRRKKLALILDAAHMAGTRLHGKHVGGEADVAVFSFHAVKPLPTADSGMVCFSSAEDDELVRKLTWLGINKDTYTRTLSGGTYKWLYEVEHVGFKYHGNSIMAAIALVQLKYLDQDNAYRRQLCEWYISNLRGSKDIQIVPVAPGCEPSRHLFQVLVDNRDELILALNENGVYPGVHYRDNTEYQMYRYANGSCPHAQEVSRRILSLPLHLRLTRQDVDRVSELVVRCTQWPRRTSSK